MSNFTEDNTLVFVLIRSNTHPQQVWKQFSMERMVLQNKH